MGSQSQPIVVVSSTVDEHQPQGSWPLVTNVQSNRIVHTNPFRPSISVSISMAMIPVMVLSISIMSVCYTRLLRVRLSQYPAGAYCAYNHLSYHNLLLYPVWALSFSIPQRYLLNPYIISTIITNIYALPESVSNECTYTHIYTL